MMENRTEQGWLALSAVEDRQKRPSSPPGTDAVKEQRSSRCRETSLPLQPALSEPNAAFAQSCAVGTMHEVKPSCSSLTASGQARSWRMALCLAWRAWLRFESGEEAKQVTPLQLGVCDWAARRPCACLGRSSLPLASRVDFPWERMSLVLCCTLLRPCAISVLP